MNKFLNYGWFLFVVCVAIYLFFFVRNMRKRYKSDFERIFRAAAEGDIDSVLEFIEDNPEQEGISNYNGWNLLMIAIINNQERLVTYLTEFQYKGYNPFIAVDYQKSTALMRAVLSGNYNIVKTVIDKSYATLNFKDTFGNTALHYAAVKGDSEMLRLFSGRATSINEFNDAGVTPLMGAAMMGKEDNIKVLLELGADLNLKNKDGQDAKQMAMKAGHIKIYNELNES